jgi:signal peptidase I
MNFFERRRCGKLVHHLLHEAQHARNMKGDVAEASRLRQLSVAEDNLKASWALRDLNRVEQSAEEISSCILKVSPPRTFPRIRENVEIIAVALAVAMGCRTYFVQPFKIPTGSMQPTLYGITAKPQLAPKWMDRFPLSWINVALFGDRYVEVRAKTTGYLENGFRGDDAWIFPVNGVPHVIRLGTRQEESMTMYVKPGDYVKKGQLIASGRVDIGDHIFVDKVRYNFTRPKRGQIIVFSTDKIQYPNIRPDSFYIKRLAALPGESVTIDPPYLVINGQRITEPYPFQRLLTEQDKGYIGYTLPHQQAFTRTFIENASSPKKLGPRDFLPLGDNTAFSLDGRYFGPVDRDSLVGPAFMVYWPFSKRWGFAQ